MKRIFIQVHPLLLIIFYSIKLIKQFLQPNEGVNINKTKSSQKKKKQDKKNNKIDTFECLSERAIEVVHEDESEIEGLTLEDVIYGRIIIPIKKYISETTI